ncbi:MAG: hypothetical protein ACE5EL_02710, partial [Anaerolineae bacterium]
GIEKDLTVEQVLVAAERCAHHGVGALFPFIVGFPGETEASVAKTFSLAARLAAMSPNFAVRMFSYQPYPGSPLYEAAVARNDKVLPDTLEGWGRFDYVGSRGPWTSAAKHEAANRVEFYVNRAWSRRRTLAGRVVGRLARWRCRHGAYALPAEMWLARRRMNLPTTAAGCRGPGPGGS